MNVPASLVETIDVGTAVTSMIVRTAVLTKDKEDKLLDNHFGVNTT